jgi:hypothetical protein
VRAVGTITYVASGEAAGFRPMWSLTASADVMIRLKRIFPRAEAHRTEEITLVHTEEVARDLEWALVRWPFEISATDRERLSAAAAGHRKRERVVEQILTGDRPHLELTEPARPAREYQLVAADLALTNHSLLLVDALGLGKSMSGLLVLRDPERLPALVVCPTHLPRQWQDELAKTLPWLRAHIIRTGQPYDPRQAPRDEGLRPRRPDLNYHKLSGWVDHLAGQVRTVIFDEAQELRRSESRSTRRPRGSPTAPTCGRADRDAGLQLRRRDPQPDVRAGAGRARLARGVRPRVGPAATGTTRSRSATPSRSAPTCATQGLMLRRTRKDVGRELPEVVRVPHSVDADEKVHEKLMEGAVDLAHEVLGSDRKQAFVASGELDWQARQATGVAKAPYVAEFVRMILEAERKVVLFGWHRDVYEIWLERLAEFNPVLYTGSESAAQKEAAKERFLSTTDEFGYEWGDEPHPDESRVLIMSLRSGAGLDGLQEATNVAVFGELDWSPGMHEQCIGRLHRDGQDDAVVAYFLVSDVGSDPVIADVLNVKRSQSEPLRDPDAELFEVAEDSGDRVRRLAETVLEKRAERRAA